jgi:hypothetical protein
VQTKDFKSNDFGCVAKKGVGREFLGCVARKRLSGSCSREGQATEITRESWGGRGIPDGGRQAIQFGVVKFKNDYSISVLFVKELLISGLAGVR